MKKQKTNKKNLRRLEHVIVTAQNKEETWYIFNDSKHDYMPIYGVKYEVKEKEDE